MNTWLKYAAVFVLAFISGAFSLYLINHKETDRLADVYNEIQVPNGEKSMVALYDGTKVWLNSGTTLKYPATFSSQNRSVFVEGEAYFDVAKDETKPFVVHAGEMEIKVFGTKFNVYSYPADKLLHATLEEGQVSVSIAGSNQNFKLEPGEQFSFSKNPKTSSLVKVDTGLYTSWKENILKVEDAALFEVLKKMERWYGVKFIIDENLDTSDRYTLSIKTESLREILKVLSLTTDMKYEIENDVVKISKP
jgi:ferric-dicitrate binding protein FerR (iron transport regulator)